LVEPSLSDGADLAYLLEEQETRLCEQRLYNFLICAWEILEPGTALELNWHYLYLCDELQRAIADVANGITKTQDIIVNVPPRTLKTTIVSVILNAWTWLQWPHLRFLTASYADNLSIEASWNTRRLIQSEWYQDRWADKYGLMGDQNVKNFYSNDNGGYRISTSVGGAATGRGGDVIIVDDPQSAEEAESESSRARVISWWGKTMYPRLNDQRIGLRIVIQQRLHENDLTGYLLRTQPKSYRHINLPAEAAADVKPPRLRERYEGGLLFPSRFGREQLDDARRRLSSYVYEGQYNQRPAPEEGGLFKRWYWGYWRPKGMDLPPVQTKMPDGRVYTHALVDLPEECDDKVVAWDMSFKGTAGSDRVVGDVWAQYGASAFLLDEMCGTMEFLKAKDSVVELYERHQDASAVLIEDTANGPAIINTLDDVLPCLIPVKAVGSKTARATDSSKAMSVLARAEAGNLYLPHPAIAPWVEDYVAEFAVFPKGAHDDRIDATVYAVRRLTEITLPGAFSA